MNANEQPDGILLDLIRYAMNIATVVGGLVLVAGLLVIMVVRANPASGPSPGGEQASQAVPAPTEAPAAGEPAEPEAPEAPSPGLLALGEEVFVNQGCGACHTIEGVAQGVVGPALTNMGAVAGGRAGEAGVADAEAYVRQSIVEPNAYTVEECPTGACAPGVMPANFGDVLSEEELDALVEYLLVQEGGG
ncbi:MAG: hypothetical protein MAG451_02079 [Anaerolineales bacterium]|nr:hypothetical protein [Anaerolineales bacterium]